MTDVTVTVAAKEAMGAYSLLKAYFDDVEGPFPVKQLRLDFPNVIRNVPDGLFRVVLSGVRLKPGVAIEVTFAAGDHSLTLTNAASEHGGIGSSLDFYLDDGTVE